MRTRAHGALTQTSGSGCEPSTIVAQVRGPAMPSAGHRSEGRQQRRYRRPWRRRKRSSCRGSAPRPRDPRLARQADAVTAALSAECRSPGARSLATLRAPLRTTRFSSHGSIRRRGIRQHSARARSIPPRGDEGQTSREPEAHRDRPERPVVVSEQAEKLVGCERKAHDDEAYPIAVGELRWIERGRRLHDMIGACFAAFLSPIQCDSDRSRT